MNDSLLAIWRDVTLRPRTGLRRRIADRPRWAVLAFPAAWGVLQSFMQGAANNVGVYSSLATILLFGVPIGSAWGLLQVHVIAGSLYAVARSGSDRIPFKTVRHVVALSAAPAAYAGLAWLVAAILFGRALFIAPEVLTANSLTAGGALRLSILYLGTAGCLLWSMVLLVLGVREIEHTSTGDAIGTVLLSFLVLGGTILGLGLLAAFTLWILGSLG